MNFFKLGNFNVALNDTLIDNKGDYYTIIKIITYEPYKNYSNRDIKESLFKIISLYNGEVFYVLNDGGFVDMCYSYRKVVNHIPKEKTNDRELIEINKPNIKLESIKQRKRKQAIHNLREIKLNRWKKF